MRFLLYCAAALAWVVLLWSWPTTIFVAACLSCVTLPSYLQLQRRLPGTLAVCGYTALLCAMIFIPVATLVLLVTPQASAGFAMWQRLRAANFQMPPSWQESWLHWKAQLSAIPGFEKFLHDINENLDAILHQTISAGISGGVGIVDSTLTALWLLFLFLTLTTLCTVYAPLLQRLTLAATRLPPDMLERFVVAVRGALRGVMLGIVLVALTQGFLCGIGFAVAGVKQPAFWGLLATLAAPIPMVGTALIWLPLCIMLWFTGAHLAAAGLCLWGIVAVGGVDNILRPFFLRRGINAPLFVLVLSILCGLAAFGAVGLIAGPVLVAFSIQAVHEADRLGRTDMPQS